MSNNSQKKKSDKKNNNNINSISSKQSDSKQYNVVINQNSTFNQDNSINILLDGSFPYFQNYNNYQANETDLNKNQMYPVYVEQTNLKEQEDQKKLNLSNKENNIIKDEDSKDKMSTPRKKKKKDSSKIRQNKKEKDSDNNNQNSTNKIDYRYVKKRPIKEMINPYKNDEKSINKENQLFWFATYDKLMKTKYLLKIFNYYNNKPFESQHNGNYNLKEKTLVIKDFEIYFYENSNKPFIRYAKGGVIYTKLYLLTLKQINQIFSYLNRIEYIINYDKLNYLQRKGTFQIINDNSNQVVLPYCLIYCLGKYMNINIYAFTNNIDFNINLDDISFQKSQRISSCTVINSNCNKIRHNYILSNDKKNTKMDNTNICRDNFKLPSSKKIAKLIKIINLNYPDFSIDDIINYLIPDNKYINSITKINEIKNIFFFKKSNQNKIILSSMVRDTIKGISIQTPKSLLSSFCPAESILENNSYKNSDLFQPSKKYIIPIKDDYKFQTINTNEKDNNKTNPFIIYVCDNVQKINFVNDNQNNNNNINSNNINNINNNINNKQNVQYNYSITKNNKDDMNSNYIEDNTYLKTDINQHGKKTSKLKQKLNSGNKTIHNQNKSENLFNNKTKDKNVIDRNKIKHKKLSITNNFNSPRNTKKMKEQRISSDYFKVKQKTKYINNDLTNFKKNKTKTRESYNISQSNFPLGNLNNVVKQLNKSIEKPNFNNVQNRYSKDSDLNIIKKQNARSSNKIKLINRINSNKKDNPFFDKYNSNI